MTTLHGRTPLLGDYLALAALDFACVARTSVGKKVFRRGLGGYEPETLAAICALVEAEAPTTFLDIGANIGVFAVCARTLFPGVRTIGFEPLPEMAALARQLAAANRVVYDLREQALGAAAGTATLYVSAKSDSSNSLAKGFRPAKGELQVSVCTVDEVLGAEPGRVLIKIDTESTEPDVLRGAERTLTTVRPCIICEVLAGRTEAALMELLRPHEYTFYHLTTDMRWTPRDQIEGDRTYQFRDWLFLPAEPGAALQASFAQYLTVIERLPGRDGKKAQSSARAGWLHRRLRQIRRRIMKATTS